MTTIRYTNKMPLEVRNEFDNKRDVLATKEDILNLKIEIERGFRDNLKWTVGTVIASASIIIAIVNGYKSCIIQSIGSFIGSGGEHWICFGYTNVIEWSDLDAPQIKKLAEEVISKIPEPEAKKKNDEAFKHLMPEILKKHTAGKNIETKKAVAPKSKK